MKPIKIIVEKHADGYVAYPLGLKGVVVGEGDTYEEALADVKSAIRFHLETFGPDIFDNEPAASKTIFLAPRSEKQPASRVCLSHCISSRIPFSFPLRRNYI
jgi:predicted RNase H-like HicB family nuclease